MFISVYTIAKNEEQIAERWYNCFKEADECCVLVNNSSDETAKVLKGLGAKVKIKNYLQFRFDTARNDAMKMCSKKADLLFGCDMDDTVESGWREKIELAWRKGLELGWNPNAILYSYSVIYSNDGPKQTFSRHLIHTPNDWYWKHRIHEYLDSKKEKVYVYYPKFEVISRPIRQEHGQYLSMLEEDCNEPDCEARSKHLLAREYMQHGRLEEAIEWFNRHLSSPDAIWKSERAASMRFLSDCYGRLGFENARELWLWKAMFENPKDRDAPFILGQLLIQKKQYTSAIEILEKCLSIEKPEFDYPYYILDEWTERPILCLAEAKYYSGDWNGALKEVDRALKMNPSSTMGLRMKSEIENIIRSGKKPPLCFKKEHSVRIEIPELS